MPNTYPDTSTWNEWAKYVLKSLEDLKTQLGNSDKKIDDNKDATLSEINKLIIAIKILETKLTLRAAMSGALASMIPVAIALVIWLITKSHV